ncbi:MAG: amino acid adenylation domain-containing protein [Candidatus Korobacteraceae bacterium]
MKVEGAMQAGTTGTVPASPAEDQQVYVFPVTFAQQRLLFLSQLDPSNTSYSVPWSIRIAGSLNATALEQSLNEIVRRHEILRTTFDVVEGHPVQIVTPSVHVPLNLIDLSSRTDPEQEAQAAARNEARAPIDLKHGPMVRTTLLRLAEADHALLVTTHHIAFDGWSRRILVTELATLYEAFGAGHPSPLPELPLQYADFAVWQRNHMQGETLDHLLKYWKQQLAGVPTTLDLPTDRPRPAVQSYSGATVNFALSAKLKEDLIRLGRQSEATLFMTLLAGFQALLSRYSGQDDIVVGTPIANRNRAEVEGLIGLFANTLPLRTKLDGDPTFRALLARVKDTALGAYAHEDMPFERLVEELRPERSLGHNPMFQVVFSLQNAHRATFELPGLKLKPLGALSNLTSKFDLSFFLFDAHDGLQGKVEYNTDLFDGATIDRMLRHFQILLEGMVANPEERVSKLPLLSSAERQQILVEWNSTEADYPKDSCLHELIAQQARQNPDRIAVQSGPYQLSYGEMHKRSNQLARYLQRRGIGPDVLVGLMVSRSTDLLVAILGILKAGGAYVPLDPIYPKDRIATILDDTRATVLLTDQVLAETLPDTTSERIYIDTDWAAIANESIDDLPVSGGPENLIYVLYTSGSTGKPKGAQIEHRNVVSFLFSMLRKPGLTQKDVWLAVTTLSFDFSVLELYLPLLVGAKVVLASREQAADPLELQTLLATSKATAMSATPATWRMLLESDWVGDPELLLFCGGEALSPDLANQLLPRCSELWNVYGPTETTVCSHLYRVQSELNQIALIGVPNSNVSMYLLDAHGELVPVGVPGELYIGGAGVGRGYQNRPDLTAERFVANPFRPAERLYRSGDIASYLPDGNVRYHGRVDFQVKIRGFRIELGEIESTLASHARVERAVVVVHEDRPGGKRLVAYVVPKPEQEIQPAELRTHLERNLPDYMVPSIFIKLNSLPVNANGKIDRRALPAPDWSTLATAKKTAPKDSLELILVRTWERVLGVPNIGVEDNFFDLGGHSVLAVRLLSEVEKVVGRKVPLASLFRGSTVASLANILHQGSEADPEPLVVEFRGSDEGSPPIFAVAAPGVRAIGYALLARHLENGRGFYKLQAQAPIVQERPFNLAELRSLAWQYVAGMRALQREGPYYLIAMCGGCQIAEQMILQLESQGHTVAMFGVFDTWVLEHAHRHWGWYLFNYQLRWRWLKRVDFRERLHWVKRALVNRIRIWTGKAKPSRPWAEAYWPVDFTPSRFHAPVVLFKRPKQPYYYVDDPLLGWGARSQGGVETHEVNAAHHEVLREPHVEAISKILTARIKGRNTSTNGPVTKDPVAQPVTVASSS